MKLVPFRPEHLAQIRLTERDMKLMVGINPLPMLQAGPAFTLLNEKSVIAIGGIAMLWRGVGEAWAIPSTEVEKHPLAFHRVIKKMIDIIQQNKNLHRVQASINEDHEKSHKWVKALGFKREGKMNGYGPNGENFIRYARVRKWHF
jgi:hypothetical protein